MNKNIVAGLDIGTASIRLVVAEQLPEAPYLRVLASVKRESRGLRRGYVVNLDEAHTSVREAVREAERQVKFRIKNVVLAIGGVTLEARASDGSVAVAGADLEVGKSDMARALEAAEQNLPDFANRRVLHQAPLAWKLDGKRVLGRPEGLKGHKLEVRALFVHCLAQHLQDLMRVVTQAGLTVDDIAAAPLVASLPTLTNTQKTAGVVLANIGSQTTSIVVYEDGLPLSLHVFPLGSNDVTNDIALGLRVSIEEAENYKLSGENLPTTKRKLDEIIEARLIDMFELIEGHLKKLGRNGLLPAGIIIVGGGAHVADIERIARTALKLPAKMFDPSALPQLRNQIRDASWVVAYGLCLFATESDNASFASESIWKPLAERLVGWLRELWP